MKRSNRGLFPLLVLYALLPLTFTALYFIGNLYSFESLFEPYNLSIISGTMAFVVFMAQFLLSARVPWLERRIPQDRLLSSHGLIGMLVAGLILIHAIIKFNLVIKESGPTPQSSLGLLVLILFILLAPGAILTLRGRRGSKKSKKRKRPYHRAKSLHNLFALAGLLAAIHVLLAYSSRSLWIQLFIIAWSVLTLGSYVYHKLIRPRKRIALSLDSIQQLAPGLHRYNFSPTSEMPFTHRCGQFAYWSFESGEISNEEHPFTIASAPSESPAIIVRSSGDYTELMPRIDSGSKVLVDGPYGHFTPLHLPVGTPILGIAGGIGITPFLSMAGNTDILRRYPFHFLWSIRSAEDRDAAQVIVEAADSGECRLQTVISSAEGRVSEDHVSAILGNAAAAGQHADLQPAVFLCGPAGFTKMMRVFLKRLGVHRKALYEERFSW